MAVTRDIDESLLEQWAATRPPVIQAMIRSHPPGRLYRMAHTGQRVEIESYAEDGTVTVSVTGEYNLVLCNRSVFGVKIDELEECELPPANEPVGSADLSVEQMQSIRPVGHA